MKLYLIRWDGSNYYIVADDFGDAIELWRLHIAELFGGDLPEWPDAIELVSDDGVIQAPAVSA